MMTINRLSRGLTAATVMFLSACGGGSSDGGDANPDRGALFRSPPTQLGALSAAQFTASLQASTSGAQLLQIAGAPTCGLDIRYVQYGTVDGRGDRATATGAMFVPTGTAAACTGERPIVLYAHGTTPAKDYNLALLGSTNAAAGEAGLIAAMYAAQGYIVVAPNFVGYEASSADVHPYLNAEAQAKDMVDALTASRTALPTLGGGVRDSGKLFITGYSAGGHVAMAAHRALQADGKTVTASVGMSGPYALGMQIDAAFTGRPLLGGTVFTPLLVRSWQQAYGDLYTQESEIYTDAFANGAGTQLPSLTPLATLFSTGKLPQAALLGNDSIGFGLAPAEFQIFYGAPAQSLVRTSYADAVTGDIVANPCPHSSATAPLACKPAHPLRVAAVTNDLRTWVPAKPLLMCGGNADPTVFFANAQLTQAFFQDKLPGPAKALTTLVDLDSATSDEDPFQAAKLGFLQAKTAVAQAAGSDPAAQAEAVLRAYHGTLVPPFCNAVARGFFSQF